MRFSFGIYDFLGYMVPGGVVILVIMILMNPAVIENQLNNVGNDSGKNPAINLVQGIVVIFVCYVAGLASHGLINWLFSVLSDKWSPFKRYYSDRGAFERGLFYKQYRDNSKDFQPYSDQFVCKLRKQIERIFDIRVETIQCEAERAKENAKYTEIFHLCRTAFMKHSPDLYPRAANLLALYNCAKVLGGIFFLAAVGFFLRIVWPLGCSQCFSENILKTILSPYAIPFLVWFFVFLILRKSMFLRCYWVFIETLGFIAWICGDIPDFTRFFICYWVSVSLCPIFFYLYHVFFGYYRNTILYGFYEYVVHAEKSKDAETD